MRTYLIVNIETKVIFPTLRWDLIRNACLSFFYVNVNSLSENFDNFNNLINKLKSEFDVLGISDLKILKYQSINTNGNLQNHVIEQTPTELTAVGALLYINKRSSYTTRPDLVIYKPKKLQSVFAEVALPKKSNLIVGCI